MMQSTPPRSVEPQRHTHLYASAVFLVLSLSLLIRVGGIPHHEPIYLHADEAAFVQPAVRIVTAGDFNPHWFGHPGNLTMYCLAAVYALAGFFGGLDATELAARYAEDPTPFHVLGKYLMVFFSMCTQWGLLLLGRHFLGRWGALLVVALLACSRLDIELATTIRTDTHQSALLVFLTLVLLQALGSCKHIWFIWSGVLLGLATAVKWPSVVACVPIALCAVLANHKPGQRPDWRRALVQVGLAAGASVLGLFIAAPYTFLDWTTVLQNVANESRPHHLGATSGGFFSALGFYGRHLRGLAGLGGLILAGVGAVTSLRGEHRRVHMVPLAMFTTYLLFLCTLNLNWPRWAVPLLPYPCLYMVVGLISAIRLVAAYVPWSGAFPAMAGTLSVMLLATSGSQLKNAFSKRAHDDAYEASQWVSQNIPTGSKVLVEDGAPYLLGRQFEIYEASGRGDVKHVQSTTKYHAPRSKLLHLKNMRAAVQDVDYVILGTVYKRIREEKSRYRRAIAEYDWVKKHTHLTKRFGVIEVRQVKKRDH